MSVKCPKCLSDNPDTQSFCGYCGARLSSSDESSVSITKTILKPSDELPIASTFAGKYKILDEIGRGGMGIVYKAEDLKLKRYVALKLLPSELAGDEESRERFIREAQAAAGLSHPNICTIYEVEEAEDKTYIAMEYIDGYSIREKTFKAPLNTEEALEIGIQVAQGLTEAHKKGITHRDIKSANIMIDEKGQAKIMDFGLAKVVGGALITKEARPMGTVAYMSPEQARGEDVDFRTDIWALGVVLYEMFSSQFPFRGDNEASVLYNIEHKDPLPIRKFKNDIPAELEKIIYRSLKKKPESRYQSATEVLSDLKEYQDFLKAPEYGITDFKSFIRFVRRPKIAIPAILMLLIIGLVAIWFFHRQSKIRWAREEAIPKIEDLIHEEAYWEGFQIAQQAGKYIPDDPKLNQLFSVISGDISIKTSPPGADIYIKKYADAEKEWKFLGQSPLEKIRVPAGYQQWKITCNDYEPVEGATWIWDEQTTFPNAMNIQLDKVDSVPPGMVHVPGGDFKPTFGGLTHIDNIHLDEFLLDKYEVTNKQYKVFIDSDGYRNPAYWKHEFVREGQVVSWDEAIKEFIDRTGRPGPATWEFAAYPEGKEDYPVTGVSWYEAAAYAEFAGKHLPTVYHWNKVAGDSLIEVGFIIPNSNYEGQGIAPVGQYRGVGPFGTYDLGGNVKEWCWNKIGDKRFILGGAWNEPRYMYFSLDKRSPFQRSVDFGFRCMKSFSKEGLTEELIAPLQDVPPRDFSKDKPCSEEIFQVYKSMYAYDKIELDPKIESREEFSKHTILEKVSFNAAYGDERMLVYLLIPRKGTPPFQTVIYIPGSAALMLKSALEYGIEGFEIFTKVGRALVIPVLIGTFERSDKRFPTLRQRRDRHIMWGKDIGCSIDYLETRQEFDATKLAYMGLSMGAEWGALFPAVEERFKVTILQSSYLRNNYYAPECNVIHFAPRIKIPVLMLNGRYDFKYPIETNQKVLYGLFGTPDTDKHHILYETGHAITTKGDWIKDVHDFLDKYLGPVR